jgi:RsiW-degrading membrane proteinase PrsW (M82 family)
VFAFLIIVFSVIPNFIWLYFYLKQDPHPESPPFLLIAFFLGVFSTMLALGAGLGLLNLIESVFDIAKSAIQNSLWFMFLGVAFVEELAKFLMAFFLLRRNLVFDEPIDAIIYSTVIALGFAFVENIIYLVSVFNQFSGDLSQVVYFVSLRFIGANFLHTLTSGLVGYFWAIGIVRRKNPQKLLTGLFLATLIHGLFNLSVVIFGMPFYVLSVAVLFVLGLFLMRNAEILRQLKTPASLMVYLPENKK